MRILQQQPDSISHTNKLFISSSTPEFHVRLCNMQTERQEAILVAILVIVGYRSLEISVVNLGKQVDERIPNLTFGRNLVINN